MRPDPSETLRRKLERTLGVTLPSGPLIIDHTRKLARLDGCPEEKDYPGCVPCQRNAYVFIDREQGIEVSPQPPPQRVSQPQPRRRKELPRLETGCNHADAPGCEWCRWLKRKREESRRWYARHRAEKLAYQTDYYRRRRAEMLADALHKADQRNQQG